MFKIAKPNGTKLKRKKIHETIIKNKDMYGSEIQARYDRFDDRFIDPATPKDEKLPIQVYYPTSEFHDILTEMVAQIPTDFSATGKESEFLRTSLIEGSHLKEMLSKVYLENFLGINSYVLLKPKLSDEANKHMVLQFEVLKAENIWAEYDLYTGEMNKVTIQEERQMFRDGDQEVTFLYTRIYTMDTIETLYRYMSGTRIEDYADKIVDNPFKEYGILPVLEFKGFSENSEPMANKLIEPQLQLDNMNTNIENLINMHSNPIYTVEKTMRDWTGFSVGAGTVVGLQGDEIFKTLTADMQLVSLDSHIKNVVDRMYKTGGLTSPSLRDKMFGTDSSKVLKVASSEFIASARIMIVFTKRALVDVVKVIMGLNNKTITDEALLPPAEILPFDLEQVLNTLAVGMNLGVLDDQWFWSRYMPELGIDAKDRISEFFKAREDLNMANTNTDNIAKTGTPSGNKAQASQTKEEKDGQVGKS